MSNRNPPPNLNELLNMPNFGESRPLDRPGDPITVTQLLLEVTLIRRYEGDPRRHENAQFEVIKESIKAQGGLNNPLTVTRRPGEEHYIIEAGGNTRLRALQELWSETGDDRFRWTHVLYKPWVAESQILTRHLIENELRGEMLFGDKALGLEALRRQWAAESGLQELADGEFHRRLIEAGYPVSKRAIRRFRFAAKLTEHLPQAMADPGFGPVIVDQIHGLMTVAKKYAADNGMSEEQFESGWGLALVAADSTEFDVMDFRHAVVCFLAEWTGQDPIATSMTLDYLAGDRKTEVPEVSTDPMPDPMPSQEPETAGWVPEQAPVMQSADSDWPPAPPQGEPHQQPTHGPGPEPQDLAGAPENPGWDEAPMIPTAKPTQIPNKDLKSLRARACVLAQRIAQHYRMGSIIAPINTGHGYLVTDLPQIDPDDNSDTPIMAVWWMLFLFCREELSHIPLEHHIPRDSMFRHFSPECDVGEITNRLMGEVPPQSGVIFLHAMVTAEAREWQDTIDLMAVYREIKARLQADGGVRP